MDYIYGDLENYNDANIVSELLNENKQLKSKLEEYSGTMVQLQKDFDKLNSEYRKLEVNYSSLLKTAKAEIERKTTLITQLNVEKDMLVINAMQKTGKNILRGRPNRHFGNAKSNYDSCSDTSKATINKPDLTENQPDNGSDWRHKRLPSDKCSPINSVSSMGTVKSTSIEDERKKTDVKKYEIDVTDKVCKGSEPLATHLPIDNDSHKATNKIMNRRKSMSISSKQDVKFSSDEDMLDTVEAKDRNSRLDTRQNVRTGRLEETSKYHELSKDKNKTEKYNRDKHTPYHKSRRYSPKRGNKRTSRVLADDHSNRSEYRSQRVLESPPSNKYNRGKSRDLRSEIVRRDQENRSKSRDSRFEIERRERDNRSKSRERRFETERRERYNQSKSCERRFETERRERDNRSKSHERRFETDRRHRDNRSMSRERRFETERTHKDNRSTSRERRFETERRHRDNRSMSVDRRFEIEGQDWDYDICQQQQYAIKNRRSVYEEQPSNKRRRTEAYDLNNDGRRSKYMDEKINLQAVKDFNTTCQSPDYDHFNTNPPHHFIREIMHTSTIKQDDPRITSNKYVVKKQDGKTSFNRVAGEEVDIRPVNKSVWGIPSVEIPEALKVKPTAEQNSDNFVREVYSDIEKPCMNLSLESGELQDLRDVESLQQTSAANLSNRDVFITKPNQNVDILKTQETGGLLCLSENPERKEFKTTENSKNLLSKYKIPKVQKTCNSETDLRITKIINNDNMRSDPRVDRAHKTSSGENLSSAQANKREEVLLPVEKNVHDGSGNLANKDQYQKVLSAKDIEGDLELSDEEGDDIDLHDAAVIQQKNKKDELKLLSSESHLHIEVKSIQEPYICTETEKQDDKSENKITEKNKTLSKNKATTACAKDSKKHKSKSKKSSQDHKKKKILLDDQKETKKNTDNKCKESQLNKNKFSELFGDSNSLITPDELGIQVSETPEKYTSVFDDTQDAIDLSIEEMEKIKKKLELKIDRLMSSEGEVVKETDNSIVPVDDGKDKDLVEQQIDKNTESLKVLENNDVVKTIIISTGTQPDCVIESTSSKDQIETPREVENENNMNNIVMTNFPLHTLKALATSTPCKVQCDVLADVADERSIVNSESASNDPNTLPFPDPTSSACAPRSEADAPDMRIFVKRRRKIKKP